MSRSSEPGPASAHRHALCVGIGEYTNISNHDLRYAVADAEDVYEILADPARGGCTARLLTTPEQTTKEALTQELHHILNPPDSNDLVIIYLSCHGEIDHEGQIFRLLPSDAVREAGGLLDSTSILDIFDLVKQFVNAHAKNIVMLLDVCYSGGAGDIFSHLPRFKDIDNSIHIISAALRNSPAKQSSAVRHGIFTDALLKAFQQKPNNATGWITIMQIIEFLQDEIQTYQRPEYENIQSIRTHSSSSDSKLRIVKNPRYSKESAAFAAKVARLLEMRSYEKEDARPPHDAPANFYLATVEAGMDPIKDGIIPIYNEAEALIEGEVKEIANFVQEQVMQGNMHRGMIVLAQGDINNTIHRYNSHWLKIRTFMSIQSDLINFQPYLEQTSYKYMHSETEETPPLADVYIPLRATNAASGATPEIESAVRQWLVEDAETDTSTRLVILADYGSGKSTFCTHLAATLAGEYREDLKRDGYSNTRIPLLIPLKNFGASGHDLSDYVIRYLKEECNIESARRDRLLQMAEGGQLLFLLDGFDEMASKASAETLKVNIAYIDQLARGRNKVLVTTRLEFLFNLAEEQNIFRRYQRFSLNPFDAAQIERYVQKRVYFIKPPLKDWGASWQKIKMIPGLSDLFQRPVLLDMIVQTLPDLLAERTTINRTNLYRLYIDKELNRRLSPTSRQGGIGGVQRLEIMRQMAFEIYRADATGLSIAQIHMITRGLLTDEQQKEMEIWLREIAVRSLLTRKKDTDTYEFSHESFKEYLVACHLAQAIKDNKQDLFEVKIIKETIKGFLLELEEGYDQKSKQRTQMQIAAQPYYQKATLVSWFGERPRQKTFSSNIFSLLVDMLPHEEIMRLPLRNANLTEVDLSHDQLQLAQLRDKHSENSYLEGADLRGVNLNGAMLRDAKLNNVNLEGAKLNSARLEGACLPGATLKRAEMITIYLTDAHLEGAKLMEADLEGGRLEGAKLPGANLEGAKLKDVNLRGANLEGANLRGANLEGANFQGANLRNAVLKDALHLDWKKLEGANLKGAILPKKDP